MAGSSRAEGLEDYREVPERVAEWYDRHPDARIETGIIRDDDVKVVMQARVYKTGEADELPTGTGHSYLDYPGATPFTRGSELENAETSAIGRALFAAGIPSSSASTDFEREMKYRPNATPDTIDAHQIEAVRKLFRSPAVALATAREVIDPDLPSLRNLTPDQANVLVAYAEEHVELQPKL